MLDFFTYPQVEFHKCLTSYGNTETVEQCKSMADTGEIHLDLVM